MLNGIEFDFLILALPDFLPAGSLALLESHIIYTYIRLSRRPSMLKEKFLQKIFKKTLFCEKSISKFSRFYGEFQKRFPFS